MVLDDILQGESKNIEFKSQLPVKSEKYLKSIIAFANTSGGKLILGIDDKTLEVVGVDEQAVFEIMDSIANAISDSCTPQLIPDITFQRLDDKCIIIVEIYPGANRPYYLKQAGKMNGTYVRVAATSRVADEVKIRELEMEGQRLSWDELSCIGYEVREEAVQKLCSDIKEYRIASVIEEEEKQKLSDLTVEQLINWKVLKRIEGKLMATNAFALLCGNYFRFARIQCALFKGNDRDLFIDKREYSGPVYEQIEESCQFVLKHINRGTVIQGIVRQDVYELPVASIREMIVNAVCHRNYMDESCIQVAVYDNRVEVTSPGMLYHGLTLEEAKNGRSKIRNRVIAEIFNKMGIVEQWGTGIQRMIRRARENELREPEFLEIGGTFRVNLYREKADNIKKPIKKADNIKKPIKKADNIKKPIKKADRKERENILLAYIRQHGSITNRQARELLGLADSTTKRILKNMTEKNILEISGENRLRKYILKE